jgi:hypothetical protein
MQQTWQIEVLVFKDDDYDDRDTILVLVEDEEWLRAHYDFKTSQWVETKTANCVGLQRNAKQTPKELLGWLLGSSAQRHLTDKIAWAVQRHFDTIKDRKMAEAAREHVDFLRKKAQSHEA